MEDIKARGCHPEDCDDLTQYILSVVADQAKPFCPKCGSRNLVKQGVDLLHGKLTQRYRCKTCHKEFRPNVGFSFKMKHSNQIIQYAHKLSKELNPAFSSRDIAKRIEENFGIKVSNVTIVRWLKLEDVMETTGQTESK